VDADFASVDGNFCDLIGNLVSVNDLYRALIENLVCVIEMCKALNPLFGYVDVKNAIYGSICRSIYGKWVAVNGLCIAVDGFRW